MAAITSSLALPRKPLSQRIAEALYPYSYITPALVFMVIASFFPLGFTVYIALTNWKLSTLTTFHFVGLANFKYIFTTANYKEFLGVLWWTIVFAGISTIANFTLGLFLAYILNNENMWERNIYRTFLIVPWALPGTIAILAWQGILNKDFGLLNVVLHHDLGLPAIPWLMSPFWARVSVIMLNIWLGYPFMMTACLGALQSIPPELPQAAEIDGANPLQKFWYVTFPLLRSATIPLVVSTFAYNLNNFGVVYLLTQGGPPTNASSFAGATDILPSYTYGLAENFQLYGIAAAYAIIVFFIIGGLSLINFKLTHAFEEID
jgi:arabinogalactan oligomer/maltooligosaccharide transport system permease protein